MYQIVKCERTLKQYLAILPRLKEGEVFFGSLQSRNKYSEAKITDSQLSKFTATHKTIYNKIKKLEVGDDLYIDLKTEQPIEKNAMTLFLNMNPRNLELANLKTASEINKSVIQKYHHPNSRIPNPVTLAYANIQTTKGTQHIIDVDIDVDDKMALGYKDLLKILHEQVGLIFIRSIIETRGGYHVQVNELRLPEAIRKRWFMNLKNVLSEINGIKFDYQTDSLTPVAGCVQGDYVPRIIYFSEYGVVFATGSVWHSIDSVKILDPDGFDRKDYDWSFNSELLTFTEYSFRKMMSTVMGLKQTNTEESALIDKVSKLGDPINHLDDLLDSAYEGIFNTLVDFKKEQQSNNTTKTYILNNKNKK